MLQTVDTKAAARERAGIPLDALNFFLADVRDGLGPYLAIYLLAVQKWDEASIGAVMTVAGIAGILAQGPAGALIDSTRAKRALVVGAALLVTVASVMLPFIEGTVLVTATQSLSAIAAAVFPPAIAAITLGIVGPKAFAARTGRNEGFNHAGNAVAAALAAVLAFYVGPVVVFWLMAAMAVASIAATLAIPAEAIDHDAARGLAAKHDEANAPSGWAVLLGCRPLLIFAAATAMFHFANAAMLPLAGQKLALGAPELATSLMAACIVAAQLIMVPVAVLVGHKADAWGRKPMFLAAFAVLAIRGALYPLSDAPAWIVGVQLLDGVGAGIFGALFPIVVADLTQGTGHFNVSLGAIATATGLGAAISASVAGLIVVNAGYGAAFLTLGAVAAAGFVFYLVAMVETRGNDAAPCVDGGGPAASRSAA